MNLPRKLSPAPGGWMQGQEYQRNWSNGPPQPENNAMRHPMPPPIATAGLPSTHQGKDYTYQEGCSLIVNYLPPSVASDELLSIFSSAGQVQSCKVMYDPKTRVSKGFGFVNFTQPQHAERAVKQFSGMPLYGKSLKVSFARPSSDEIKNTNVYVSGLPLHYRQEELEGLFFSFGTIITSTLLREANGASRGQGLVRFNVKAEAEQAIEALNESVPDGCTEAIAVRFANPPANRNALPNGNPAFMSPPTSPPPGPMMPSMALGPVSPPGGGGPIRGPMRGAAMRFSPMEKTGAGGMMTHNQPNPVAQIYVCPLDHEADDIDLYRLFSPYGAIQSARVIKDTAGQSRGFGFINMMNYHDANLAVETLNGAPIKGKPVKVSFKMQKNS